MAIYRFRKEELEGQLNRNALWAIVYGDMMSYLMILFLLMLSWTLSKQVKDPNKMKVEEAYAKVIRVFGGEIPKEMAEKAKERDLNKLFSEKLQEDVEKGEFGSNASVIVGEKRITLNLGEGVLFDSGKAELKPDAVPMLERLVSGGVSRKNQIRVEGHTDDRPIRGGSYKSNWELSMARAYTVLGQLQAAGVEPQRLSGVGYGEYRPVADNRTPEGRAQNRRIEISLLREEGE